MKDKIDTIDKYRLNLYCKCLDCEKFKPGKKGRLPHSCDAHTERDGIPPKIWNTKNAQCEYFESKHSAE